MSKVVSLLGMVVAFVVAYGCERFVEHLRREFQMTTDIRPFLWFDSVALIILAAAVVILAWYVLFRTSRDVWVAAVFIVVGVGVTIAWAAEMTLGTNLLVPSRIGEFLAPDTYVRYVGALVAVIGIASLAIPRRLRR